MKSRTARGASLRGRLAIFATSLVMGVAGIALAHATLRRADPPMGSHVSMPLRELRLEFSERVSAATARVDIVAPDSQRLALPVIGDSSTANVLIAHVPPLHVAGRYRVEWRLVGPDGHAVTGRYELTVDSIPIVSDSTNKVVEDSDRRSISSTDSTLQRAIRFVSSSTLVVMTGSVAFVLLVLPVAVRDDRGNRGKCLSEVETRLRSTVDVGSWLLIALGTVRLLSHGATLSGSMTAVSVGDLGDLVVRSPFGHGWLLQMCTAIALLLVLRLTGGTRWRVLAGLLVPLAISAALLGHPAAVTQVPLLAVGLDASHVLGAGGWAGTIVVIAVVALPQLLRMPFEHRLPLVRSMLRAFTPLALTCAVMLVLTGAASAWLQLGNLWLVFSSDYGSILVRKVVLVLLMAALGAYHWRIAQPSLTTERAFTLLRRSLAVDVALVLMILILTAILTGTAATPR